ncbi:hypothetical protein ACKLNR_008030 [Fusarium oxysporum f. sp. zingiberi]
MVQSAAIRFESFPIRYHRCLIPSSGRTIVPVHQEEIIFCSCSNAKSLWDIHPLVSYELLLHAKRDPVSSSPTRAAFSDSSKPPGLTVPGVMHFLIQQPAATPSPITWIDALS